MWIQMWLDNFSLILLFAATNYEEGCAEHATCSVTEAKTNLSYNFDHAPSVEPSIDTEKTTSKFVLFPKMHGFVSGSWPTKVGTNFTLTMQKIFENHTRETVTWSHVRAPWEKFERVVCVSHGEPHVPNRELGRGGEDIIVIVRVEYTRRQ